MWASGLKAIHVDQDSSSTNSVLVNSCEPVLVWVPEKQNPLMHSFKANSSKKEKRQLWFQGREVRFIKNACDNILENGDEYILLISSFPLHFAFSENCANFNSKCCTSLCLINSIRHLSYYRAPLTYISVNKNLKDTFLWISWF